MVYSRLNPQCYRYLLLISIYYLSQLHIFQIIRVQYQHCYITPIESSKISFLSDSFAIRCVSKVLMLSFDLFVN